MLGLLLVANCLLCLFTGFDSLVFERFGLALVLIAWLVCLCV